MKGKTPVLAGYYETSSYDSLKIVLKVRKLITPSRELCVMVDGSGSMPARLRALSSNPHVWQFLLKHNVFIKIFDSMYCPPGREE